MQIKSNHFFVFAMLRFLSVLFDFPQQHNRFNTYHAYVKDSALKRITQKSLEDHSNLPLLFGFILLYN